MTEHYMFDPERALAQVEAMQRVRQAYGDAPDPIFAAAVLRNMYDSGLDGMFVTTLDDGGNMVWALEVKTGRGSLKLLPAEGETWRGFLGNDPTCVDFGLLPPDAPR